MSIDREDITAVILAGGQGRRMGGQDKGLIEFDGKPLVAILVEQLSQQTVKIVINANRNHERYQQFGYPVITDALEDYQGPLAGFASAMAAVDSQFILTLPCDGPLLSDDYVARFIDELQGPGNAGSGCIRWRTPATRARHDKGRPATQSQPVPRQR